MIKVQIVFLFLPCIYAAHEEDYNIAPAFHAPVHEGPESSAPL